MGEKICSYFYSQIAIDLIVATKSISYRLNHFHIMLVFLFLHTHTKFFNAHLNSNLF